MAEIIGKRVLIRTEDQAYVKELLESCGSRFEFVERGPITEVRYTSSLKADAFIGMAVTAPQ